MYRKKLSYRLKDLFATSSIRRKNIMISMLALSFLSIFLLQYKNANSKFMTMNPFRCWWLIYDMRWSQTFDLDESFLSPTDEVTEIPNGVQLQTLTLHELSLMYRRYITTLQYFCSQPARFGSVGSGGFRICVDKNLPSMTGCVVQSFNYELSGLFRDQIKTRYNCSVHMHESLSSFHESIKNTQNSKKQNIFIFKLYPPYFSKLSSVYDLLKNIQYGQMILEIHHGPQHDTKEGFLQLLSAFREFRTLKCHIYWYDRNLECIELKKNAKMRTAKCFTINLFCDARTSTVSIAESVNQNALPDLQLLSVAKNLPVHLKEIGFMAYISKHQILCSQVRRMGNIEDGGWDICNDVQFRPKSRCLVYSFGIAFDFSFDEAMEKVYGCDVYSFDPSMGTGNCKYSNRIHFYEVGLEKREGKIQGKHGKEAWEGEVKRLSTLMNELGHENKRIDVLKIDIEGHEHGSFVDMISSGALKNVAQLCVEFHSYHDLDVARQLYDQGFRIFWTHQNPVAPMYLGNETFSHGFEVSFVNVNL